MAMTIPSILPPPQTMKEEQHQSILSHFHDGMIQIIVQHSQEQLFDELVESSQRRCHR